MKSGAILLPPLHDGVFITFTNVVFDSAVFGLRLLVRPAQAFDNMPDAGGVVGHAEALFDQFGHPLQGPEFGRIAELAWPFQKHFLQPSELPIGQLRSGSGMGLGLEGFLAAALAESGPLADGSGGHAKLTGDIDLCPPMIQQIDCPNPPPLLIHASGYLCHAQ